MIRRDVAPSEQTRKVRLLVAGEPLQHVNPSDRTNTGIIKSLYCETSDKCFLDFFDKILVTDAIRGRLGKGFINGCPPDGKVVRTRVEGPCNRPALSGEENVTDHPC